MIYVDKAKWKKPNGRVSYCHLVADSLDELHEFAKKINVGQHFFHSSATLKHYDLSEKNREIAISNGALEISSKDLVRKARLL